MRSDSCFAQGEGRSRLCPVMRPGEALLAPGLDDLLAAIVAARADVMTQMHFAGRRFDREGRGGEKIVSAVHATLRRRFLVLLDCHRGTPSNTPTDAPVGRYDIMFVFRCQKKFQVVQSVTALFGLHDPGGAGLRPSVQMG